MSTAARAIKELTAAGRSVAVAESLTGGLVSAALTSVPGASAVVRGGVVSYATDTKHTVLGVDDFLLRAGGPVQAEVARQMAHGVRRVLGADLGIATTGAAGPDPQGSAPVGRVFIAVAWESGDDVRILSLTGSRDEIRSATVEAALNLLMDAARGTA
ncbi:nicotinamide-nucleotide amidase [Branchiibius hedensis]|uniref:Nicotinamide-nucleotide amidase n=1 Tax=Branchiibius hedensis TaxID=672460 RepID=A0A2Y8ZMF6_9MICO|nr:CinA family protein [Branchiibius hedensis]PWJ24653.1 nicotinamide-nucleotide amidase [Branchiibius hedensis]SSA33470.1 nicotinamide-nucleotide amidase [Branchiibius hedensis]